MSADYDASRTTHEASTRPEIAPAISPESKPGPIFVIGPGRSGTTLLRAMLNAHPRIYLTDEASFYLSAVRFPQDRSGGDWLDYYTASWPFLWLGLDPDEIRSTLSKPLERDEVHHAIDLIMRLKAASHGKPRYGDKTPLHGRYLRHIFDDFPEARVVHIVRSPRATVESLTRMPWAPGSYGLSLAFYKDRLQEVEAFRDRICEIRLEDLIADPQTTMREVLAFVGEPWDDRVLDHPRHTPVNDRPPFPWLQPATERVRTGQRRPPLPPAWVRVIESETQTYMKRYGYEPAVLDGEPSRFDRMIARIRDLPAAAAAVWRMGRIYLALRGWRVLEPTKTMRLLHSINPAAWRNYPDFQYPELPGGAKSGPGS